MHLSPKKIGSRHLRVIRGASWMKQTEEREKELPEVEIKLEGLTKITGRAASPGGKRVSAITL